jgi:hypothetical protein
MGERIGAYRILVEKLEGKRQCERPVYRRGDNIKMVLQKWRWVAWTGLIWLRIGIGGGHL